ncbi:HXXEE domain-containing protein [Roseiflexus sp.]|uniref:HXXEE domain-containing protein n=1 Tax=Roseiflexus sp. TaxID=2562120 RepID=UPI0021DECC64|nr:HXXEE domain-containing protein [Roseiflexus sp.]GIV98825.1 MAG: hypothetical protein KatS3mg058_0229 [Roseiflexus sp.]
MKFLIKYNLSILSAYTLVMLGVLVAFWDSFSLVLRFTIGFLGLITLHEWEETRFPGGFWEVMSGMLKIDISRVPDGALHLPPAILIFVITLLPLLFPGVAWLFLAVMYLGIFEGIVHAAGIKLTRRKKPYTPGMITAEMMLVYSIVGIVFAVSAGLVAPLDWLLALAFFLGGFLLMEVGVYRVLNLKLADGVKAMKANLRSLRG